MAKGIIAGILFSENIVAGGTTLKKLMRLSRFNFAKISVLFARFSVNLMSIKKIKT
jgi:hypothetical protein